MKTLFLCVRSVSSPDRVILDCLENKKKCKHLLLYFHYIRQVDYLPALVSACFFVRR